jgi:hypothetical protein
MLEMRSAHGMVTKGLAGAVGVRKKLRQVVAKNLAINKAEFLDRCFRLQVSFEPGTSDAFLT